MHQAQYLLRRIYYGFDEKRLYFRFDAEASILKPAPTDKVHLNLYLVGETTWKMSIVLHGRVLAAHPDGSAAVAVLERETHSAGYELVSELGEVAIGQIVELAVERDLLGLKAGDEVYFYATLEVNHRQMERCPARQPMRLQVPQPNFETKQWLV